MADVVCPKCWRPVPVELVNTGREFPCGGCGQRVVLDVFPAAWRAFARNEAGLPVEGAASCFFHDERPAQAACDACGRFVCALCDIPVGAQHLCPECLEARNRPGAKQSLANERVPWDRVALVLALLPIIMWPVTIVTAPAALFLAVRHWNGPGSLVGRPWPRFVIAAILSVAQIAGWIAFIVGLATGFFEDA